MALRAILLNPTLLTVAVVYGLLFAIAYSAGLFGWWLRILLALSLWRFGYAVLRAVAQGRQPVAPSIETMNPVSEAWLAWHFLFFYSFSLLASQRWALLGVGVGLLLNLVFPASAGLMALTGNLAYALNPLRIVSFIREVGLRYAGLLVATAVLAIVVLGLQDFANSQVIGSLWVSLTIEVWGFLALFALVGAVIYTRRDVFDIPGLAEAKHERQQRWDQADRFNHWQSILDTVYANWRSDQQAEAYDELRKLIAREKNSVEVLAWLFEKTLEWQDKRCALELGRRFVARLLENQNEQQALDVVLRCRRYADTLSLDAGSATRLADYARGNGQLGLADELASWETGK